MRHKPPNSLYFAGRLADYSVEYLGGLNPGGFDRTARQLDEQLFTAAENISRLSIGEIPCL
jgi:hypothetical protein